MRDSLAILYQSGSEFFADRDHPARFPFARRVLEADGPTDLTMDVVGHPPSEPGYLLKSSGRFWPTGGKSACFSVADGSWPNNPGWPRPAPCSTSLLASLTTQRPP
jgi:hypothetical protein